jgi:hypothetical protein
MKFIQISAFSLLLAACMFAAPETDFHLSAEQAQRILTDCDPHQPFVPEPPVTPVPEPESAAIILVGMTAFLCTFGAWRGRKKDKR